MTSKIMPATQDDIDRAETLRNKLIFKREVLEIITLAESSGFRTIYVPENKGIKILTPSRNVLDWDFNPRSLDSLGDFSQVELRDAALYAGYAAQSAFPEHF